MDKAGFRALMDSTGIYYDQVHPDYIERSKVEELPLPFLEFDWTPIPFFADGINYFTIHRVEVRLYTDVESELTEAQVSAALTGEDLSFRIKKEYLPNLNIWQTTCTVGII